MDLSEHQLIVRGFGPFASSDRPGDADLVHVGSACDFKGAIDGRDPGELILRLHEPDADHMDTWTTIERADPVIVLDLWTIGDYIFRPSGKASGSVRVGDVLRVEAEDRRFVYRFVGRLPGRHAYILRWVD